MPLCKGGIDVVRCFLTGVQVPLESAFVLNRREARALLAALSDRVTSLRRLIDQFAPLDVVESEPNPGLARQSGLARRKHRLVCKAVADAMSPGYPEIHLFLEWPKYQDQARVTTLGSLRGQSRFSEAIKKLDDEALRAADRLAHKVLNQLDPNRGLPKKVRLAICGVVCARHRSAQAVTVTRMIRDAATGAGDATALGLEAHELAAVRQLLLQAKGAGRDEPATQKTPTTIAPDGHSE